MSSVLLYWYKCVSICANKETIIIIISDMQHCKTYNYFNFQQNLVSRSVKTVHTNVFAKIISYIDLQIPLVFSKKSIILDKHHRITYMYINF